jgi:dTDP-4-dehydrorhamnose reductase
MKIFLTGSTSYLGTKFVDIYGNKFDIFGVSFHDEVNPIDLLDKQKLTDVFKQFNPDVIVHLAADLGRDITTTDKITKTNPEIVENLVELALPNKTPFIFTSSEAVYGGKWDEGDYSETDNLEPRNPYGMSKVIAEKILVDSGLPYLITRGHRYVGIPSKRFDKAKQFPDTIKNIVNGNVVHLDSKKIFCPVLINNICDIINHYIESDLGKKVLINMGINKKTTYFDFVSDVVHVIGLDKDLLKSDGDEAGWPNNSSLNMNKMIELGYPSVNYEDLIRIIALEFKEL